MKQLLFIAGLSAVLLHSQEFEVASIKPSAPATGTIRVGIQMAPGGRVVADNVTLRMLIQQAYGVKDFQVTGGPDWMSTERFDINAKGPADLPPGPGSFRPMLQALLKERFHLEFQRESKEASVYNLVVGKGGAKMKAVEGNAADGGERRRQVRMGRGLLEAQAAPIALLAEQLSNAVGRNVIDKTELNGLFDFKLEFTPEPGQGGGPFAGGPGPGGPSGHPSESSGPSVFTAIQEQLGLKLESAKGPVEILVITRAEKPTEN